MKTVVLGAGRMGRRHIQVVKEMGLDLVGICDPNPDALALAQSEQGVSPEMHFLDAVSLLEEKHPECVVVSTTAPTHSEYTRLASDLGAKYILCEKPMAVSLAECDQMLNICKKNGTRLAINHQMRFMEQYIEPKRLLNSAEFGGLASITVVAGNFGMAMNGAHYFEMFRYMTDEAPIEVSAWFSQDKVPNPRGTQFEDRAGSVRMTTASGKRFYMEIGSDQGLGLKVIYAARYGQIVVDELAGTMSILYREEQYRDLPTTRYGMPAVREEHIIKPADVIAPSRVVMEALLNKKHYPSGEDGRLALAALIAAYFSDENGHRPVSLKEVETSKERIFPWA
ncbi:MAG: Gfo/Idh/MocA family oxidoreductase [Candidatus Brocadiales bacterium]|nr:Gfo/Idh/MocA family oxidoreductase [Candidatus Brocadiales bacterium]